MSLTTVNSPVNSLIDTPAGSEETAKRGTKVVPSGTSTGLPSASVIFNGIVPP